MSKSKLPASKRGRGRPPLQGKRKTSAFNTRLDEATRLDLERHAARNGRSLSHEIQVRLRQSLKAPRSMAGEAEDKALAGLMSHMSAAVSHICGASWRTDPFAFATLRIASLMLLEHLQPAGELVVPARIAEWMEQIGRFVSLPPDMTPEQTAAQQAAAIVNGTWHQLQTTDHPPLDHPKNQAYGQGYYTFPSWREALKVKGDDK